MKTQWTIITAVNNEEVLESCLLNSPGVQSATELILQRGHPSATSAYNDGIQKATTDLLVFVHQDVYLPEGWIESASRSLALLTRDDPNWGVVGLWGTVDYSAQPVGYLWWTGDFGWENPFEGAKEVVALDEVLLIVRKSSGLSFDDHLPGYHLYGTDICLEAKRRGQKSYAISAFCLHNTDIGRPLPLQFWKSYLFMRQKWKKQLPIMTPCTRITKWCWPILHWNLVYIRDFVLGRRKKLKRVRNPDSLYRGFLERGLVRLNDAPPAVAKRGKLVENQISTAPLGARPAQDARGV